MFNLFYVIFMNFHRAPLIIPKMRYMADHPEKYTEIQRYEMTKHCIYLMNKTGKITTQAFGLENLPEQGGYIMYPNHQGKYDLLGIIYTHQKVCSFVMDKAKSHTMLVREFVDLVQAKRLEKDNPRQGITIINEVARDVAKGKRYVLFPEGGYKFNNKNKDFFLTKTNFQTLFLNTDNLNAQEMAKQISKIDTATTAHLHNFFYNQKLSR